MLKTIIKAPKILGRQEEDQDWSWCPFKSLQCAVELLCAFLHSKYLKIYFSLSAIMNFFGRLYMAGEACGQDFTGTIFGAQESWLGKKIINWAIKQLMGQTNNRLSNKTSIAKRTTVNYYPRIRTHISEKNYKTLNRLKSSSWLKQTSQSLLPAEIEPQRSLFSAYEAAIVRK